MNKSVRHRGLFRLSNDVWRGTPVGRPVGAVACAHPLYKAGVCSEVSFHEPVEHPVVTHHLTKQRIVILPPHGKPTTRGRYYAEDSQHIDAAIDGEEIMPKGFSTKCESVEGVRMKRISRCLFSARKNFSFVRDWQESAKGTRAGDRHYVKQQNLSLFEKLFYAKNAHTYMHYAEISNNHKKRDETDNCFHLCTKDKNYR